MRCEAAAIATTHEGAIAIGPEEEIWYCNWLMLFMTLDMPDEGTR